MKYLQRKIEKLSSKKYKFSKKEIHSIDELNKFKKNGYSIEKINKNSLAFKGFEAEERKKNHDFKLNKFEKENKISYNQFKKIEKNHGYSFRNILEYNGPVPEELIKYSDNIYNEQEFYVFALNSDLKRNKNLLNVLFLKDEDWGYSIISEIKGIINMKIFIFMCSIIKFIFNLFFVSGVNFVLSLFGVFFMALSLTGNYIYPLIGFGLFVISFLVCRKFYKYDC